MREWLASIVGESLAPIMTVILAAALVVLLALVLIGLAKRIFAGSGGIGGRSRAPRLAVLDMAPVDPKRKLVLVRRDDVEHLILIGGQNDLVVEPGIVRSQARRPRQEPGFAEPEQRPTPPQQALPHRRTPRPGVQPVPSEAQAPGTHPPIAPVAETRVEPTHEARVEPAPHAAAVMVERGPQMENRGPNVAPPPMIPVAPEQRSEPIAIPPAPIAAPPAPVIASAPPVAPPPRIADETPAARRTDPAFPPEPTPASRRSHGSSDEAPQAADPVVARPMPPIAPAEPATRRPDAVPAAPERIEPPLVAQEPPRQAPVVPPVAAQRPVAPLVAQTVVPPVPVSQPAAPPNPSNAARPTLPQSPSAPYPTAATPPVQPPAPRSMATPTLPQLSRATPVAPQPRTETEVAPARSLWSPAPSLPVAPPTAEPSADASSQADRNVPSVDAAPPPAPMPERIPVRWPPAPLAPRADESAKAEVGFAGPAADAVDPSPAPLSVKSFATTIQERRATIPAETPVAPPVPARPPQVEVASVPMPTPAASAPQRQSESAAQESQESERALTLEEEMERLLHDFTIDVSERR